MSEEDRARKREIEGGARERGKDRARDIETKTHVVLESEGARKG